MNASAPVKVYLKKTGTDALIAHFAKDAGVDPATLPLLSYYSEGVFRKDGEMFRELRQLKGG